MSIPASREQLKDWCFDNKYTKWYFMITDKALNRTLNEYTEKHHILPKSIHRNNEVVKLTAREHFICHLLLPKMLIDDRHRMLMQIALHRLIHGKKNVIYCKSSKIYDSIKKSHSIASSKRSKDYWSKINKEQRSKMRSGKNNSMFGKKMSEETKNKISNSNRGKLSGSNHPLFGIGHSIETKKRMSDDTIRSGRNSGKNNPMFGRIGASSGKKWYHNPETKIEKYFVVGKQLNGFKEGRLRNV